MGVSELLNAAGKADTVKADIKKYELTDETISVNGHELHRIRALKDIYRPKSIKAGDLGGFIETEGNLSQEGKCWVYDDAKVYEYANVHGDAKVSGKAKVYGYAEIFGEAEIEDEAVVHGDVKVFDEGSVSGKAMVTDNIWVCDNSCICGNADVVGHLRFTGKSVVSGPSTKKYDILWRDTIRADEPGDPICFRIKALKNFTCDGVEIHIGDLGGYIEDSKNLSQDGNCWVFDGAHVTGDTVISGDTAYRSWRTW